jgi:SsrA-binding protein
MTSLDTLASFIGEAGRAMQVILIFRLEAVTMVSTDASMNGGMNMGDSERSKVLAQNKKASHDFFIEETFEAGLVLTGTEIKSIRQGKANLMDSFATIRNGEAFVHNMHVSPFEQGNRYNPTDPTRHRKLLLRKDQIAKLIGASKQQGYTIVPLKIYVRNGYAKLLIGLGKGKKQHDKRATVAKRDADREIQRALREKQKVAY